MKVCIYGAGAIGGWIGARLALSGNEVSVVARGATLLALREHGLRLETAVRDELAPAPAGSASTSSARTGMTFRNIY